ncbi:hypothetical protein L596_003921 [Steinernema carpocapsae]|uniref:Uncharacterized protein n=1 Tax=Steinernema carpocapsae TaxID=34508 RepID=A0A4U8UVN9_STECR|nr:hypothetical protein L596_003921 [Steinernema carpocapsae]
MYIAAKSAVADERRRSFCRAAVQREQRLCERANEQTSAYRRDQRTSSRAGGKEKKKEASKSPFGPTQSFLTETAGDTSDSVIRKPPESSPIWVPRAFVF